jgi:ABC-type lipopolysaccharide export system ATPase subunit
VLLEGDPDDILTDARVRAVYLGEDTHYEARRG